MCIKRIVINMHNIGVTFDPCGSCFTYCNISWTICSNSLIFIYFQLYNLLFGTVLSAKSLEQADRQRYKRDVNSDSSENLLSEFADLYQLMEPEGTDDDLVIGLLYKVLSEHGDWQTDPETLAILSSLLGFGSSTEQLDPVKVVDMLRVCYCFELTRRNK